MSTTDRQTALHRLHGALGGRMIGFHGWSLPVAYGAGILAEHRCVRETAGCFDLGHMGRLRLEGPGAPAFLQRRVTRNVGAIPVGRYRYALICNEQGGVEDDVLIGREGPTAFHIVVNAANLKKILDLWTHSPADVVHLDNLSDAQAMIAVQGPQAMTVLQGLGLAVADLPTWGFRDLSWGGRPLRLSRTGYTGEDGCECFLEPEQAAPFWQALLAAGVKPCGLGARDTLRLEAGMPLYGHELDERHSPLAAGLDFAVDLGLEFIGAPALRQERAAGGSREVLAGLQLTGTRPAREGHPVLHDGTVVGRITSGTHSPTLNHPIAMAWIPPGLRIPGTVLSVDIRGQASAAQVVCLPFYQRPRRNRG